MAGKCDRCPKGSITLQAAPLYVSGKMWLIAALPPVIGIGIGATQ